MTGMDNNAMMASKAIDLMNKWNFVEGTITRNSNIALATDSSHIYKVGSLAILYFNAELSEATTTATENIHCYTLPWAPPTILRDYRNLATNYIRSNVIIDTDGKVYFKQTGGHSLHVCTIMFPIALTL